MNRTDCVLCAVGLLFAVLLALPLPALSQNDVVDLQNTQASKEELAQLVAPIALYPDELISQILMASTYPLEIVQADRWVQQNRNLNGDALAKALESQKWDPSVKSLVNFPSVLSMMSQKLDLTSRLGDAFLSQEKEVMATIQELRKKAYDTGTLKSTPEQEIVEEKETIVIRPVDPQVVYVPTYNPAVVYGVWMYPDYPPYYYFPPPPLAYPPYYFASGISIGLAWGYAWGTCNWHGSSVYVNVWRNRAINNTYINRNAYFSRYQTRGMIDQNGQGQWRHDPSHRRGVAYASPATAQRFGQSPARASHYSRDVRGYGQPSPYSRGVAVPAGRTQVDRGGVRPGPAVSGGSASPRPTVTPRSTEGIVQPDRTAPPSGSTGAGMSRPDRPQSGTVTSGTGGRRTPQPPQAIGRDSAFSGRFNDGPSARSASDRGRSSRQSPVPQSAYGSGSRPGGSFSGSAPHSGPGTQRPTGGVSSGGTHGGGYGGGGHRR